MHRVHQKPFFSTEFPFGTPEACFLHRVPLKTRRVHQEPFSCTARPIRTLKACFLHRIGFYSIRMFIVFLTWTRYDNTARFLMKSKGNYQQLINIATHHRQLLRIDYSLLIFSTNSSGVSISILEKPNHFLPKSLMDAPM